MINELTDVTLDNPSIDNGKIVGAAIINVDISTSTLHVPVINNGTILDPTVTGAISIGDYTISSKRFGEIIKHLHIEMFPEDHI